MGKWTPYRWMRDTWLTGKIIYDELFRTRAFVVSAAMAFYFLLSIIPLLIIFSAALGYLPIPNLFAQMLDLMATFVPPDAMTMMEKIVASVLTPHRGGLLSFGILSYLWTASGGFSATIEALNIAYDVPRSRSWWRDRLQALLLTFTTGFFSILALLGVIAGPHFGHFLVRLLPIPRQFAYTWPLIRGATTFIAIMISVEMLYYLGPNVKQRFRSTLPGAVLAVAGFFIGSAVLDIYFGHFSNYNKTYGSLGAVIILMLWFYVIALFILIGAELNAEFAKRELARRQRGVPSAFDQPMPGVHAA